MFCGPLLLHMQLEVDFLIKSAYLHLTVFTDNNETVF